MDVAYYWYDFEERTALDEDRTGGGVSRHVCQKHCDHSVEEGVFRCCYPAAIGNAYYPFMHLLYYIIRDVDKLLYVRIYMTRPR